MKKLISLAVVALALVCMSACSSSSGPEDVVKKAITALQKGNYDAFASTYNLSSEEQKQLSALAKEKISKSLENNGGIKSFKVTDTQINGDEATVKIHMVYKDGTEEDESMKLKKVDGEWKQVMVK